MPNIENRKVIGWFNGFRAGFRRLPFNNIPRFAAEDYSGFDDFFAANSK